MSNSLIPHASSIGSLRWWLLALPVLMIYVVLSGTPWGLGVTPDSVQYFTAATSFHHGNGFVDFSSHWPPIYPMAIATVMWLQGEVLASARSLNAGLAAANLVLLALVCRRCDWRADVTAILVLLLGLQVGFLHIHFLLWSEPLFLTFVLADLLFLQRAICGPANRWVWSALIASAAAAILVRYAGLFLLILNAGALLLFAQKRSIRIRVLAVTALSVCSTLPFVAWIAFNHWRGVAPVNRSLAWHSPSAEHVQALGHTVAGWFGLSDSLGLPVAVLLLMVAAHSIVATRIRREPAAWMPAVIALSVLAYSTFLFLSISIVDHYTPLDERLLFPIFPMVWLLLWQFALQPSRRIVKAALLSLLSIILLRGTLDGWEDWRYTRENGLAMTSRQTRAMPVLEWLRTLPPGLPIVSNGPDLCTIYLQRSGKMLPRTYDPTSLRTNPNVQAQLETATQGPTLVVYFQAMAFRKYLPGPDEIEKLADMQLVYRGNDALAWIRNADEPLR